MNSVREYWDTHLEHNPLRMGRRDTDAAAFVAKKLEDAGDTLREWYKEGYRDKAYLNEKLRKATAETYSPDWLGLNVSNILQLEKTKDLIEGLPTPDPVSLHLKQLLQAIANRDREGIATIAPVLKEEMRLGQTRPQMMNTSSRAANTPPIFYRGTPVEGPVGSRFIGGVFYDSYFSLPDDADLDVTQIDIVANKQLSLEEIESTIPDLIAKLENNEYTLVEYAVWETEIADIVIPDEINVGGLTWYPPGAGTVLLSAYQYRIWLVAAGGLGALGVRFSGSTGFRPLAQFIVVALVLIILTVLGAVIAAVTGYLTFSTKKQGIVQPPVVGPPDVCAQARQRLEQTNPFWSTATCDQIRTNVCATFPVGDPIRVYWCKGLPSPSPKSDNTLVLISAGIATAALVAVIATSPRGRPGVQNAE